MDARPAVIVLAAGKGSRFRDPEHKLVQELHGQTVLARTLSQAIASELPVVVVTTPALADVARGSIAVRDVIVVPEVGSTRATPLGMGYSIAAGVSARPNASGWLILPGDMPEVRPTTLQRVARELETHAIVYAQYKGRRGHPVGFSGELYSELIKLIGDEGARRLVARYPAFALNVDDPGVLVDIDTVADLDAVRRTGVSDSGPDTRW